MAGEGSEANHPSGKSAHNTRLINSELSYRLELSKPMSHYAYQYSDNYAILDTLESTTTISWDKIFSSAMTNAVDGATYLSTSPRLVKFVRRLY